MLENPTGTSLGSVTDAVVTIADAESAGVLSFSTAGETTLESQEPAPLVVTRTGSSLGVVTVDYRVTGGTAISQESPDAQGNNYNYFDTYGTLTFQAGQTTATIPITTLDPYRSSTLPNAPVFGDPLTIDFTLGDPTGGAILGAITTSVDHDCWPGRREWWFRRRGAQQQRRWRRRRNGGVSDRQRRRVGERSIRHERRHWHGWSELCRDFRHIDV